MLGQEIIEYIHECGRGDGASHDSPIHPLEGEKTGDAVSHGH